jgi:hypothetical protein
VNSVVAVHIELLAGQAFSQSCRHGIIRADDFGNLRHHDRIIIQGEDALLDIREAGSYGTYFARGKGY